MADNGKAEAPVYTYKVAAEVGDRMVEATLRELRVVEMSKTIASEYDLYRMFTLRVARDGVEIDVGEVTDREVQAILAARRDFLRASSRRSSS